MDPIKAKTKHGELTLDEIASLMPGMSELMVAIGQRFQGMVHACRQGNWQLGAYQFRAIRKLFQTSKLTRPKYGQAMDEFFAKQIAPVDEAIRAKDWPAFSAAAEAAVRESDRYHKDWGYECIRYRLSEDPNVGYRLAASSEPVTLDGGRREEKGSNMGARRGGAAKNGVVERLDAVVDDFCRRVRFFREDLTVGRAKMFVLQHRLNTRQRNSVLKLRVATNCPDWKTRIDILTACAQEVIADHEHGGGKAHWQVLEELGTRIGLPLQQIRDAKPIPSTQLAWLAWEALMTNRHWLEGIVANTCAERANVPGHGEGAIRERGWFGYERIRWKKLFNLPEEQLEFFKLHEAADLEHSEMGWKAVARFATELHMEDAVVEACRTNLLVWEQYLNGIADAGDGLEQGRAGR